MKKVVFWLFVLTLFWGLAGRVPQAQSAANTIRFATVAPEGTAWLNAMRELGREIESQTKGEVKVKIYASSKMGDELDALRKIRSGQIHAGAFSGMGLGEVHPDIRVMELPFFFESQEEIDYVNDKMFRTFQSKFSQKGMVLIGTSEAGFVHLFTQKPISKRADLNGSKVWVWEGDPLAKEFFEVAEVVPVPLPVTEVITALQTGMVSGVYAPPMGLIGFQWWPKVSYMMSAPLINATGGILVSQKKWNTLSPANQKIIMDLARKSGKKLTEISRADNEKAIETLQKNNIKLVNLDAASEKELYEIGAKVRTRLNGKLYSAAILKEVEKHVRDYRAGKRS